MVQIENEKVIIEIAESFPGDYIRELHNSLCTLIHDYDSANFSHENIQIITAFIKELIHETEELDRIYKNKELK